MRGLIDIFDVLYKLMPQKMVWGLFVLIVLSILPLWYRWIRNKKIKGLMREVASTSNSDRKQRLERHLWKQVGDNPKKWAYVAVLAKEMGLPQFRIRAEAALIRLGHAIPPYPIKDKGPDGPGRLHPIEIRSRVTQLLEQQLPEPAQHLINEALLLHPEDPDLLDAIKAIQNYHTSSDTIEAKSSHHES